MKKIAFLILLLCLFCTICSAEERFGIGIIAGEPTGLSMKLWAWENSAIDFAFAWSFAGEDAIHIHSDYLFHNFSLLKVPEGKLPFYYGIGVRVKLIEEKDNNKNKDKNDTKIGARIPLGLAYIFANQPIDIFAEIVPIVDLVPDTDLGLNAAIGARYFF